MGEKIPGETQGWKLPSGGERSGHRNNTYVNVLSNGITCDPWKVGNAAKQGGNLSPLIFNFYLNNAMRNISDMNDGCFLVVFYCCSDQEDCCIMVFYLPWFTLARKRVMKG